MPTLNELKANHQALWREVDAGYRKMTAGNLPQNEGEALEAKAQELETIQAAIDTEQARLDRFAKLSAKSREVPDPVLPRHANTPAPSDATESKAERVVGYMSLGDAFARSDEFKSFTERGMTNGTVSAAFGVKGVSEPVLAVTEQMLAAFEAKGRTEGLEIKAIPTIAAGVIATDRLGDLVRTGGERPAPRMRDVMAVRGTTSNSIQYNAYSYTDAAAPTAESGLKPEAALAMTTATAPVRTLPVWIPVTEQQLQDVPQIVGIINQELIADLKALEDRQILYGSGAGENLQGLLTIGGVGEITRTVTNTTNVDRISIGATDIANLGGTPNAFVIHPTDWEQIVLAKGTDNRYMFASATDANGVGRIWGLTPVVTQSAKNPANLQRYILVGDFVRGAQLHDRQQASIQIGYANDDFLRNKRSIRAEERLAMTIQRPFFFAKYETATAS